MVKSVALSVKSNSSEMLLGCMDEFNSESYLSDYRDVISGIAIVYDGAIRLGLNADEFLYSGLDKVNSDKIRNEIIKFIKRQPNDKRIEAFGYKLILDPTPEYKFSFL